MRILAINCGSSSFKFELIALPDQRAGSPTRVASGLIDRIGDGATASFELGGDKSAPATAVAADHAQAMRLALKWLRGCGLLDRLDGVGHRVVHGGDEFAGPALIDDAVIKAIDALRELAPLHNGPSLDAIRAARDELGDSVPMAAVFDTSFHRTMPPPASHYAVPSDWVQRHRVRRYGFHGIAHRDMAGRCAALMGRPVEELRLITLQLGNGCSAAAIHGGRSIDTTMGFTPLEGLMMGTRSGELDPSVPAFVAAQEQRSVDDVVADLNHRCGLLGVSGLSRDMRELEAAAGRGHAGAALAIEIFCYRVRKAIGSYLAVVEGADAVVFGGGIGEHAACIRAKILGPMRWCGLELDPAANASMVASEGRISTNASAVRAYVISVDEALLIARDTAGCVSGGPPVEKPGTP